MAALLAAYRGTANSGLTAALILPNCRSREKQQGLPNAVAVDLQSRERQRQETYPERAVFVNSHIKSDFLASQEAPLAASVLMAQKFAKT